MTRDLTETIRATLKPFLNERTVVLAAVPLTRSRWIRALRLFWCIMVHQSHHEARINRRIASDGTLVVVAPAPGLAWAEHGVIFFRDQYLTAEQRESFARRFG